jgi:hypothetical protein
MVLKNEIVALIFSTVCTTIQALEIDQSGIMALNCYIWPSSIIYLYDSNGTFTGQTWVSPGIALEVLALIIREIKWLHHLVMVFTYLVQPHSILRPTT